ncbi:flavodoxin [Actinomyces sp.]|uniref:flavodoxin n=1 Tax=Actinomyces sp. TaxID=29317 RepID=UPI0026DD4A8A|nr:flavodoxin [Actinomyces sp.]MDO4901837.1 flavodoxin [Actinomyces sp.]
MTQRTRIIALICVLAVVAAGVIGYELLSRPSASSSSTTASRSATPAAAPSQQAADAENTPAGNSSVLVVYFSRTEGVYGGDLTVGNTARIAQMIQERTGADSYEIVPAVDYPSDYQETTEVAQDELDADARPAIRDPLPDVSGYDTVFVGAPIWWGEYPMVIRTFLDAVDLNGKTVIPFTTHEGSGMGNTRQQLEAQYPRATVPVGLAVRGSRAADARPEVDAWLEGLGL